ncbi:hypothetical protein SDC9_187461 [bioreactor metagenome]|uniref:Uncharacterized protein n=1 Tax=bioreactor metagenome TaxID=1076179 RepID=A0A645HLX4_9ZZZZ
MDAARKKVYASGNRVAKSTSKRDVALKPPAAQYQRGNLIFFRESLCNLVDILGRMLTIGIAGNDAETVCTLFIDVSQAGLQRRSLAHILWVT